MAALVVGVLAVVADTSGRDGDAGGAAEPASTPSTGRATRLGDGQEWSSTTTTAAAGPARREPVGLVLATAGPRGVVLTDLDTGMRIGETFPSESLLGLRDGVVVVGLGGALYVPAAAPEAPVELGEASDVLASDRPDRVWLARRPDRGAETVTLLREVDLTGAPTSPELEVRGCTAGPVAGGLLIERLSSWFLLERDGDSRLLFRGHIVGATVDRVAYATCDELDDCAMRVLDVPTGSEQVFDLPPGTELFGAWAGPYTSGPGSSERLVVVWNRDDGHTPALALLDLTTGALAALPSRGEQPPDLLAWSPAGDRLFMVVRGDSRAVWSWRVGDTNAEALSLPAASTDALWEIAVISASPAAG